MSSTPRKTEFTMTALALSLVLSIVMGAANVYLGLRVGMTVSASIPAAVVAMAILSGIMRRNSMLEANFVQTGASAGESLAAGIIFTMPALVVAGIWEDFDFWVTGLIALSGGLLGALLMIPMRKVFIIDSPELQFPEGVACAEVLKTGYARDGEAARNTGASLIFWGLGVGGLFKFVQSFLGLFHASAEVGTIAFRRVFFFGADIAPALVAVGMIIGLPIALQIFSGGAIAWLIGIPLLSAGTTEGDPTALANSIWKEQVRYIGVGAMLVGGLSSIWKVRGGLVAAVHELRAQFKSREAVEAIDETERNISGRTITIFTIITTLVIGGVYYYLLKSVGATLLTTAIMLVMSFFFTAVASYIVGLVGSSNSPVSGMTITAVLGTGGLLYLFNAMHLLEISGTSAIIATLGVAGIICCVASTAGDVCNDLKTGQLVGASPRLQQLVQIAAIFASAFFLAPVMSVLHKGSIKELGANGGIGGETLPAPQAVLFSKLADGIFGTGQLPWTMIEWGIGVGVALLIADFMLARSGSKFRLHVMPVAVGMYLPFGLAVTIAVGGLVSYALSRAAKSPAANSLAGNPLDKGTLVASGVIAGESLVGVLLGFTAYYEIKAFGLAERFWSHGVGMGISAAVLLGIAVWMYMMSVRAARS